MRGDRMASWGGSRVHLYLIFPNGELIGLQVLAHYLALRGERYCMGKTILELGSGTGLVGLVIGKLGGKVWITDQALVSTRQLSGL